MDAFVLPQLFLAHKKPAKTKMVVTGHQHNQNYHDFFVQAFGDKITYEYKLDKIIESNKKRRACLPLETPN